MRGIRRTPHGFIAYVKVGGVQRGKRFKPDTKVSIMHAWRDETKVALRKLPKTPSRKHTFGADAVIYLQMMKASLGPASYASRVCEIEAWFPYFKHEPRKDITRERIQAIRTEWLTSGRSKFAGVVGTAPKTINHRVRALTHLFHTLDGSKAETPCDDLSPLKEPDPDPQFVPARKIIEVARKLVDARTRARFMVLASTGQRPAQLKRAVRTDVNLRKRLWMVRRAKGGTPIPVLLTDDMIAAWKAFIAADAWGSYDGSDYAKQLYEAGWPRAVRPYNAKHTVAITLGESGAEWEDIKEWFGHTDIKTTRIYTGMIASRLKRTSQKLAGRLGWK